MGLFSFFQSGAKYFDKKIDPKCDYCMYGKRTKDGNRVLCEKRGLVEQNYSCKAFIYSPLKRIPVKQLRFVGSIADDDLFIESKGDIAEKQEAQKKPEPKNTPKAEEKPAEKPGAEEKAPAEEADKNEAPAQAQGSAPAQAEVPKTAESKTDDKAENVAPAENKPAEAPNMTEAGTEEKKAE